MPGAIVHLPNGKNLTVSPVFGGFIFKSNDLSNHNSPFPPGWTIGLSSEVHHADEENPGENSTEGGGNEDGSIPRKPHFHRYKKPTLQDDHLYISSISNPSSNDFKPATSPTRQIAMMLWATLYWYFHQPEPELQVTNSVSKNTADPGKPKGEWRISIDREGIFKGKVVLPKLERMGLITTEDSSVGVEQSETTSEGWTNMFVSRRSFWQLDPRIYLFTLSPMSQSGFPSGSPYSSRPSSPVRSGDTPREPQVEPPSPGLWSPTAPGPFRSTSHLPTYYPPPPPQYIFTNSVRHPLRPKPPRQGEVLYTRFIPSVGQYLSFRVASLSNQPLRYRGPSSTKRISQLSINESPASNLGPLQAGMCDVEYLHKWMNDPRVNHFWGEAGPQEHQEEFLKSGLQSRHSFPVIGCWDGKPFGYFEIYWVKEDRLGRYLPRVGDYDRGLHCLVGEDEFRGPHRVKIWLTALVHYCLLADLRTESVMLEPRIDNEKLRRYLEDVGFYKEREVSLPHKQSNLMRIGRDNFEGPAL